jgi:hypothetical protein
MNHLNYVLPLVVLLAACGPEPLGDDEVGESSSESETGTSEDTSTSTSDESSTSESSTSDDTDTSETTGETETETTGDTDTDGFGNGEDACEGVEFEECTELGWADITQVVLSDADQDGAWSPGEALTATVTYASTGDFINYPALVAQADHPLVSVPWATSGFFGVVPGQPIEYEVVFEADPTLEVGTQVGLKIGAAVGLGQVTACDCPDVMVDAWIEFVTIE